jgi:hypothetical protein
MPICRGRNLPGGYLVGDTNFGSSLFCQRSGGHQRADTAGAWTFVHSSLD